MGRDGTKWNGTERPLRAQATIFGVLGDVLRNVNDLLNISGELRVNFMLYVVFGLPYFALQIHFRNHTWVSRALGIDFMSGMGES